MDYARLYPIIGFQKHGRIGHLFVFEQRSWGCRVRPHVYPYNPRYPNQQAHRALMHNAVMYWKSFNQSTQYFYNIDPHTKHMSGYNRYIQLYINANK